jgi:hypothetical protein
MFARVGGKVSVSLRVHACVYVHNVLVESAHKSMQCTQELCSLWKVHTRACLPVKERTVGSTTPRNSEVHEITSASCTMLMHINCCIYRVGQNSIHTPYMTICMVISLLKIPYAHHTVYTYEYMVLAHPMYIYMAAWQSVPVSSGATTTIITNFYRFTYAA